MSDAPAAKANPRDADSRARKRESEPITIGGREFRAVRRTPAVMREFRAVVRRDEQLAQRLEGLEDADYDGREEIEDERQMLMYEMLAVFVREHRAEDQADREPLPDGFLAEHVDVDECSSLLELLTPGDSDKDPTPAASAAPTSS